MLAYQIVGARNEAESAGFQHTGMLLVGTTAPATVVCWMVLGGQSWPGTAPVCRSFVDIEEIVILGPCLVRGRYWSFPVGSQR